MQPGILELDLHGMNTYQAKIAVNSCLKRAKRGVYRIRLIHGYHSGTALRDMLRAEYRSHPSVLRLELPMQMATGAVAAGLLGQAVLRKGLISRGEKVEYPKLSSWRVPKGWGRILGGTLFGGNFL